MMSYRKSKYRPRSYSYRRNYRRGGNKFASLAKKLLIGVIVLALGGFGLKFLFSGEDDYSAEATLQVLAGSAEFSLNSEDQTEDLWTRVNPNSPQTLLQGDKIKTTGIGKARLEMAGNNVFLAPQTELEISRLTQTKKGEKNIELTLKQGEVWVMVVDDDFSADKNSQFKITTNHSSTLATGTIFDVKTSEKSDTVRLTKGKVEVRVLTENKKNFETVEVGVGQKLVVDETTLGKIKSGDVVLEINDNDFIRSDWNLNNLTQFYKDEADKIREEIEKSAEKINSTSQNENIDPEIEAPKILEPAAGVHIPAEKDSVEITGTVAENIFQVSVNGYTLTKFQPGDRKWSYFASRKFGTILPGENKYSVKAIRRDGKESAPTELIIFYDGSAKPAPTENPAKNTTEPSVVKPVSNENFKAPEILKPVRMHPDQAFQTASQVVTISGIVDPKTVRVEVNGFQLRKFRPGDTDFHYIANANYTNMKKGENIYEVIAHGPNGEKASSSIKIIYTPLEL